MYRKSSKGNPYHDQKGRFTSANGMARNKATGIVEDRPIEMWSSFGELHTKEDIQSQYGVEPKTDKETKNMWEKADREKSYVAENDGRRHYHRQSITREDVAKNIANYKIPKGTPTKERADKLEKSVLKFKKENAVALRNGATLVSMYKGQEAQYQVVESKIMSASVMNSFKKHSSVTVNTSTHMKQFSGYTVEFFKGNTVRSCKKGASEKEVTEAIEKFCHKHRKDISDKNTCIKVWKYENQVKYMPVFKFKTKAEADEFSKSVGGRVVNHDDGYMA